MLSIIICLPFREGFGSEDEATCKHASRITLTSLTAIVGTQRLTVADAVSRLAVFSASCKSSDVIYLITCRRCGLQYVGETGRPLHMRVNGHRYDIVHQRPEESLVAEHFNSGAHAESEMTVMVIELARSRDSCLRKIRESRWMRTLRTSSPSGMNLRVDSL